MHAYNMESRMINLINDSSWSVSVTKRISRSNLNMTPRIRLAVIMTRSLWHMLSAVSRLPSLWPCAHWLRAADAIDEI